MTLEDGKQEVSASVSDAVPHQLREHVFTADNQPNRLGRPKKRADNLTACLKDYLSSPIGKNGLPPANVIARYNPNTNAVVQALVCTAMGDFSQYPNAKDQIKLGAMISAQRELWQRAVGRPGTAVDLNPTDDIMEGITLEDRKHSVPLPLTSTETPELPSLIERGATAGVSNGSPSDN